MTGTHADTTTVRGDRMSPEAATPRQHRLALDRSTGKPFCVLIQAALRMDWSVMHRVKSEHWVTLPTSDPVRTVFTGPELDSYAAAICDNARRAKIAEYLQSLPKGAEP
jgi:hypothetical protein